MTTTSTPPAASSPVRHSHEKLANDFTELSHMVTSSGLMRRRYGYYWTKLIAVPVVLAAFVLVFIWIGDSWWQLATAAVLAVVLTQVAMLGHDAAHRQIFRSGRWNDWTSLVIGNLFVGMSYGWWQHKHTRHHANPNKIGADPDIDLPVISFTPEQADRRRASRKGPLGWMMAHQGVFFFPILLLEGLSLHASSVRRVFSREPLRRRPVEIAFLAVRLIGYLALVFLVLSPGIAFAFLGVQLGSVRGLHGDVVRAQPQGDAAGPGRREGGLPPTPGADEPQRPRQPSAGHGDGRTELSDRASPVPVDAAPSPACRVADDRRRTAANTA